MCSRIGRNVFPCLCSVGHETRKDHADRPVPVGVYTRSVYTILTRACEQSVSGAKNGAERAENRVSRNGAGAEQIRLNRPLKVRSHLTFL